MDYPSDCPFCASGELEIMVVQTEPPILAVRCRECGSTGPASETSDPRLAVGAWNMRYGRLTLVR